MRFGPGLLWGAEGMAAQTGPLEETRALRVGSSQCPCPLPSIVRKFLEISGSGIVVAFRFVSPDLVAPPRHLAPLGWHKIIIQCLQWDIQKTRGICVSWAPVTPCLLPRDLDQQLLGYL